MSWTSHAYHVAKDFQTLGAASLALAAAGLTFYAQRWVAERQAATAIAVLDRQLAEQKRKDDAKEAQIQAAFRISLKQACSRLSIDLRSLSIATRHVLEKFPAEEGPIVKIDEKSLLWTRFKNHGPYSTSQSLLSMPFSEVAQADQPSQAVLVALIDRCGLVDRAKEEVMSNLAAHGALVRAFLVAVEEYSQQGSEMAQSFRDGMKSTQILDLAGPRRAEPQKT